MKKYYRFYITITFGILVIFGVFSVLMSENDFSENENRYLEQYPAMTVNSILSGEYQSDFEKALNDQFLGRDQWLCLSTLVDKIEGLKAIDKVYLAKEKYYIPQKTWEDVNLKQYVKNLQYAEYIGDSQKANTSLLLVPSAGTILKEKLPDKAPFYDGKVMYQLADTICKKTKSIDTRSALKEYEKQNQVYFKTDHHWSLLGAYAAYSKYCDSNKFTKHTYGYFVPKKITEDFYGTMYSKVLDPFTKADDMYAATNILPAQVRCDEKDYPGIYDVEKLIKKDKYGYFFGGNYGEVTITMKENPKKKLLVVKDSFANSFVPFLMGDYDQITMLDLRYYRKSVQQKMKDENYSQILILYEMSNFAQDKNLYKLVH